MVITDRFAWFFNDLCPGRVDLLDFDLVQTLLIENTELNSTPYFVQLPADSYLSFIYLEFAFLQIHVYTARDDRTFVDNLVCLGVQEVIVPFVSIDTYHLIVNVI